MMKSKRDYLYFLVQNTPYLTDINDFITNLKQKEDTHSKLIYFENVNRINKWITIYSGACWALVIIINFVFTKGLFLESQDGVTLLRIDQAFIPLIAI